MSKCLSIVLFVVAVVLGGCGSCEDLPQAGTVPSTPLSHSMKGYELYSWRAGDEWCYTLITGTDRAKTGAEITSGESTITEDAWVKISVQGTDALREVLGLLPNGEEVIWFGDIGLNQKPGGGANLALPGEAAVNEIRRACQQLGLELHVIP